MSKKKFNAKKVKNIITVLFALILLFWVFQIDWNNISSKTNSGAFFGVLAAIMIIISMQIRNKESKK